MGHTVYSDVLFSYPEIQQKLVKVGNQAAVMRISLLHIEAHLCSDNHTPTGLKAQQDL